MGFEKQIIRGDCIMSSAQKTTDHDEIRRWVEKRGGRPARVADTAPVGPEARRGSGGILRIDFAKPDDSLEEISWDDFFKIFEKEKLAFLYQDKDSSRFVKFVDRD
jgi:hypothetical protein